MSYKTQGNTSPRANLKADFPDNGETVNAERRIYGLQCLDDMFLKSPSSLCVLP